ncbi:hypothetical protein E1B28_002652 [Marasmius oreades]|uniref:Uncharacterized protein n=1 Tax=Marasmius oreades TaxID=181124 RepID=A0A9P7UNB2_9AGAR|nr:uncharacterized protein E1B28_002652 [Marasmius oreades]KAG7086716.1 hypothetical protein E1B28_002652 [Marasmius oreades]
MPTTIDIRFDGTNTHILSEKAIREGWDTFIFYKNLVRPGNLFIGLNTARHNLGRADVARWLSILVNGTITHPPEIYNCAIKEVDVLQYLPTKMAEKPISWTEPKTWAPGNYTLETYRMFDQYWTNTTPETLQVWMSGKEVFPSKDIKPVYTIEPVCSSNWPADDTKRMQKSMSFPMPIQNMIILPSLLVDDFYLNRFGFDIQMGRFVTFPGIPPKTNSLLQATCLKTTSSSNVYMARHFRECLRVHCFFGDIRAENGLDKIWARSQEWDVKRFHSWIGTLSTLLFAGGGV